MHTDGQEGDGANPAEQYRDDLSSKFQPIDILVISGQHDTRMDRNPPQNMKVLSYAGIVSRSRSELQWLLGNPGQVNAIPG